MEGRGKRVPFAPTPHDVVEHILAIADPRQDEVLYDLGSGDGRIVVKAAEEHKCRAVGVEIDPTLYELSKGKIGRLGVKAEILHGDFYRVDFGDADVVVLYLLPDALRRLRPRLLNLRRGARIICHDFPLPGVKPREVHRVYSHESRRKHVIYLYKL